MKRSYVGVSHVDRDMIVAGRQHDTMVDCWVRRFTMLCFDPEKCSSSRMVRAQCLEMKGLLSLFVCFMGQNSAKTNRRDIKPCMFVWVRFSVAAMYRGTRKQIFTDYDYDCDFMGHRTLWS